MSQHVCNISKTNLKLTLALLLPPVNAKYHLDLWEKEARMHVFIRFIWEIITIQLSSLQYWQMDKFFFLVLPLSRWVEAIRFNFLNYFSWWMWTLESTERQAAGKQRKRWSLSKEEIAAKPPCPSGPSPKEQMASLPNANTGDPFAANFM